MTSYKRVIQQNDKVINSLVEFSGLERWLVRNIVQYANQMPKVKGGEVDLLIFTAQMSRQFDINATHVIQIMYETIKRISKTKIMMAEDYARCVCMFLSDDLDLQIDYAFAVYDTKCDGLVKVADMRTLLKVCVLSTDPNDETEAEDSLRDLEDFVLKIIENVSKEGLRLEAFRKLVKQNRLYLELFGQCFPSDKFKLSFKEKLTGVTPFQVSQMFASERRIALGGPAGKVITANLYPIPLDM
ncbi:calcineurin subunit B [Biomphalaria pfeifferi]|uniref:Calcineurin subunit B n=1 Tax=Biomphalaria pfeifferi TaxID=112525 RepID=A0AAD8F9V1_BIOPF|nr:calcineurin subunit B [Biomphalaria pfeifferi]